MGEIEVCAPFHHRRRRSPHGIIGHGHPVHACVKEKKEVCKVVPKVEEKSEDVELCHIEPEKVCEEREVEVPKHVCEDGIQTMSLAESRLSSEEGVGRVERERRTEEPRQGRGGRGAGKEKEENVASEKETEKRAQRRIKPSKN